MTFNSDTYSRSPVRLLAPLACSLVTLLVASTGRANPKPLPFTYPYETLPEGETEVEQYVDATPLRTVQDTGALGWEPRYALTTELEYGLTDRLELGLYLAFQQDAGGPLALDGTKQRLRLRLGDSGAWPVDVALYLEVAELHDELEIEEKLIVQRRFGKARVMTNLWVEQSLEQYAGELAWTLNPTAGLTYQITPALHVGAEYWAHAKVGEREGDDFNDDWHHFVGPAVSLQLGRLWWTTAAYYRVDEPSRPVALGDAYGHAWVRTIVGLAL